MLFALQCGTHMNCRRYHIITTLPHVDMIVWINLNTGTLRRQGCNDFVDIHISAGCRAGLKNVYRKLICILTRNNAFTRINDCLRALPIQFTQIPIDLRGGFFDQSHRFDECRRHRQAADRKVIDGTLGLRGVESRYRHFQFTHTIFFNTKLFTHD